MEYQVKCINKPNRNSSHEHILAIGGVLANGNPWRVSQPDAINMIKQRVHTFYVLKGNRRVNVIVARSPYGHDELKTESDGFYLDNLLSLPECP